MYQNPNHGSVQNAAPDTQCSRGLHRLSHTTVVPLYQEYQGHIIEETPQL
jgi:hypothetical protein